MAIIFTPGADRSFAMDNPIKNIPDRIVLSTLCEQYRTAQRIIEANDPLYGSSAPALDSQNKSKRHGF